MFAPTRAAFSRAFAIISGVMSTPITRPDVPTWRAANKQSMPPPLPVEALARAAQRATPAPADSPRKKALVYVRPPRRKKTDPARPLDKEAQKPYRRNVPLPGMPPTRDDK